jgi:hypothetical protein
MILQATWALFATLATRSASRAGLTLRISVQAWRAGLLVTGLFALFVIARRIRFTGIGPAEGDDVALEFIFFQMTMPGIAASLARGDAAEPERNTGLVLGSAGCPGWLGMGNHIGGLLGDTRLPSGSLDAPVFLLADVDHAIARWFCLWLGP